MPEFYTEEIGSVYGCFRCGEIGGEVHVNPDTDSMTCGHCGESSIVTFTTALDMLNAYYMQRRLIIDDTNGALHIEPVYEEV